MKRVTFILILSIILFTNCVYSVVFGNWWCSTLYPDQCESSTQLGLDETKEMSIGSLQAKAAAAFLAANSSFQKFLEKYELTELYQSNFQEMSSILGETIDNFIKAEKNFIIVYIKSQKFDLNTKIIEGLKKFNYSYFGYKNNLNQIPWMEVEEYLSKGDVFGILIRIIEKIGEIRAGLEALKTTVDNNAPDINTIYKVNQTISNTGLFGQYVAMVFRKITNQRIR